MDAEQVDQLKELETHIADLRQRRARAEEGMYRSQTRVQFLTAWRTRSKLDRSIAQAEERRRDMAATQRQEQQPDGMEQGMEQDRPQTPEERMQERYPGQRIEEGAEGDLIPVPDPYAGVPDDVRQRAEELTELLGDPPRINGRMARTHEELDLYQSYKADMDRTAEGLAGVREEDGMRGEESRLERSRRDHPFLRYQRDERKEEMRREEGPEAVEEYDRREAQQRELDDARQARDDESDRLQNASSDEEREEILEGMRERWKKEAEELGEDQDDDRGPDRDDDDGLSL